MKGFIHAIALPAVVVFRTGWGPGHATLKGYGIGLVTCFLLMTLMGMAILNREGLENPLTGEWVRSEAWMKIFIYLSMVCFLAGRLKWSFGRPKGLSISIGRVRFLPETTWAQMVPAALLIGLAVADQFVWHHLRPLTAFGSFYGAMLGLDYLCARGNDREMGRAVHDAVILSEKVEAPAMPRQHRSPGQSEEGSTGELVRIYGKNRRM